MGQTAEGSLSPTLWALPVSQAAWGLRGRCQDHSVSPQAAHVSTLSLPREKRPAQEQKGSRRKIRLVGSQVREVPHTWGLAGAPGCSGLTRECEV